MPDAYGDRGQTAAKHFILRRYLQALAFKLLHGGFTLTYVDGFSGPWESRTPDHSDTSFMIAIGVLKDAQEKVRQATGKPCEVRCFFAEEKTSSYAQLKAAVAVDNDHARRSIVQTFHGRFEDAVGPIMEMVGNSFALTFIDPTGWTGYEFPKIERLLKHRPGEVLLNYMQPFIDRFTDWDDPANLATFDGILGGPGWQGRLDTNLPRSEAKLALFTEQLRTAGPFRHVVATPIEKDEGTASFRIVYATRNDAGLAAYRDAEHDARKDQHRRRTSAREARNAEDGITDMFTGVDLPAPYEATVANACRRARDILLNELRSKGGRRFGDLWPVMLAREAIRKKNAKDVCVDLANQGIVHASWKEGGSRRRTPDDDDIIALMVSS